MKRVPESAKVPVAKREQTKDMPPAEVVKFYSENEMLGKLPSGEPWAADLVHVGKNKPPITEASLPKTSRLRFFPQSQLARSPDVRSVKGSFAVDRDRFMPSYPGSYPGTARMLSKLRERYDEEALASGQNISQMSF